MLARFEWDLLYISLENGGADRITSLMWLNSHPFALGYVYFPFTNAS